MMITMSTRLGPTGTEPTEDILILQGRDKAQVIGNTPKGKDWIRKNMTADNPVTIDREGVEEFLEYLQESELTVDIK
jgi:hypothetical protein